MKNVHEFSTSELHLLKDACENELYLRELMSNYGVTLDEIEKDHLKEDRKVLVMKMLHERTGCSLLFCKRTVDSYLEVHDPNGRF